MALINSYTIASISGYVKAHEKLLALILGIGLIWLLSGRVTDAIATHDQKVYAAQTAILQAQVDKNAALAAANTTAATAYQQQAAQAQAQNVQLEQQTLSLLAQLSKQQAVDKNLPAPALAERIGTLASLSPGAIVPAPNQTFTVTQNGAVGIATTLESVPVLQTELQNSKAEKANVDALLVSQTSLVGGLNQQITGLQSQIVDAANANKAELSLVKAQAAKGKRKWFVIGYVAGLGTRGAIKLLGGF